MSTSDVALTNIQQTSRKSARQCITSSQNCFYFNATLVLRSKLIVIIQQYIILNYTICSFFQTVP